jgi:hypothetical protein
MKTAEQVNDLQLHIPYYYSLGVYKSFTWPKYYDKANTPNKKEITVCGLKAGVKFHAPRSGKPLGRNGLLASGTGGSYPFVRRSERESEPSGQCNIEVNN